MPGISEYLANRLFDHVLRGVTYQPPAAIFMALFLGNPVQGGSEVSGGGYQRVTVTFSPAANRRISNSSDVEFPEATADWGTITHFALFDAATAGNMLYYGVVTPNVQVVTGMQIMFKAGKLTIEAE